MTPKKRHSKTDSVPESDFGGQEFYDEDDLEELDGDADAADLAAFDAQAVGEDEESRLLEMRERATKGGQDDPHVASGQRLQKVLAHAGVASRRACEQLIADGRVSVDGITVTEPGVRVDPLTQEIRVDGGRILTNPELITLMLHKPAGVVTTMEDPEGRPTVAQYGRDYLAEHPELPDSLRLVHVGRLDTETEGLLLLSNDGELAHRLGVDVRGDDDAPVRRAVRGRFGQQHERGVGRAQARRHLQALLVLLRAVGGSLEEPLPGLLQVLGVQRAGPAETVPAHPSRLDGVDPVAGLVVVDAGGDPLVVIHLQGEGLRLPGRGGQGGLPVDASEPVGALGRRGARLLRRPGAGGDAAGTSLVSRCPHG